MGAAALIPVVNVIALPASAAASAGASFAKNKAYLKTDEGKKMIEHYQTAASLDHQKAKERLNELKKYM